MRRAFKEAAKAQSGALAVTLNPLANSNQKRIADLAMRYRCRHPYVREQTTPTTAISWLMDPATGIEGFDGARYLARILKGAKPADIPVEQPTKFEMVDQFEDLKQIGAEHFAAHPGKDGWGDRRRV